MSPLAGTKHTYVRPPIDKLKKPRYVLDDHLIEISSS